MQRELAIGISTEAAEIPERFRFKSPEEVRQLFLNEKKREEIFLQNGRHALFYILRMAQRYCIDLSDAFYAKMKINESRYSAEKFNGVEV